jgi:membrane associated rhomboid family serine protease
MTTTAVGMRCPECAKQRTRVVRLRNMASQPRVTYALIAVNIMVFLAEGQLSLASSSEGSISRHGALLGSSEAPQLAGEGVAHGQWWRIVTGGFLHANLLHILFNMYVLYLLGQLLEPAIGHLRFAVVYGVSLIAGSLGALILTPHSLTVGASGAVFGLMGAAAVEMRARQIPVMQSGIGALILINLLLSFTISGISIGGHIGGLIGGALAGSVLLAGERRHSRALGLTACALLAAACFAGSVLAASSSSVESLQPGRQVQLVAPE